MYQLEAKHFLAFTRGSGICNMQMRRIHEFILVSVLSMFSDLCL